MSLENNGMSRRDFLRRAGGFIASGLIESKLPLREHLESGEVIPTNDSVVATFEQILQGQHATERRKNEDALGVYLWEIEFPVEGGTVELNYMRKGHHEIGGFAPSTKIHIIFFDEDGMPQGGEDVAEFEDGIWKLT